jgi:hypothetical protein
MGGTKQGNDLLRVDDPDELFVVIDDREGAKVVFVEELGHFAAVGVDVASDDVTLGQSGEGRLGLRENELDEGNESGDSLLFVE